VTDAYPMAHSIPLAPMTEMFFEFIDSITDKDTQILGLYEGYLKINLEIQKNVSLPIDSLLLEMADNTPIKPILLAVIYIIID